MISQDTIKKSQKNNPPTKVISKYQINFKKRLKCIYKNNESMPKNRLIKILMQTKKLYNVNVTRKNKV